jgi:hypothetical protein
MVETGRATPEEADFIRSMKNKRHRKTKRSVENEYPG